MKFIGLAALLGATNLAAAQDVGNGLMVGADVAGPMEATNATNPPQNATVPPPPPPIDVSPEKGTSAICRGNYVAPPPVDVSGMTLFPNTNLSFYDHYYVTLDNVGFNVPEMKSAEETFCNVDVPLLSTKLPRGWVVAPNDNYTQLAIELFPFGTQHLIIDGGVYDHQLNQKAASGYKYNAATRVFTLTYCTGGARLLLRSEKKFSFGEYTAVQPATKITTSGIVTFNGRDYASIENRAADDCVVSPPEGLGPAVQFYRIPEGWQLALDNVYTRAAVAGSGDRARTWGYSCKWLANPENLHTGHAYTHFNDANAQKYCDNVHIKVTQSKTLGGPVIARTNNHAAIMLTRVSTTPSEFSWTSKYPAPTEGKMLKVVGGSYGVIDGSGPRGEGSDIWCTDYPIEMPSGWEIATPQTPGWAQFVQANDHWGTGKTVLGFFQKANGTDTDPNYLVRGQNYPFVYTQHCSYKVVIFKPDASPCNWEWTEWKADAEYKFMHRGVKGNINAEGKNCAPNLPTKVVEYNTLPKTTAAVQPTPTVTVEPKGSTGTTSAPVVHVVAFVVAAIVAMLN